MCASGRGQWGRVCVRQHDFSSQTEKPWEWGKGGTQLDRVTMWFLLHCTRLSACLHGAKSSFSSLNRSLTVPPPLHSPCSLFFCLIPTQVFFLSLISSPHYSLCSFLLQLFCSSELEAASVSQLRRISDFWTTSFCGVTSYLFNFQSPVLIHAVFLRKYEMRKDLPIMWLFPQTSTLYLSTLVHFVFFALNSFWSNTCRACHLQRC